MVSHLSLTHRVWEGCPRSGSYAGRDCPFSALTGLAQWPERVEFTMKTPKHACATDRAPARLVEKYDSIVLRPTQALDCTRAFWVRLFVNDVAQIVAVDVTIAEP